MTSQFPVPRLEALKITKRFGDFVANASVDLQILPGEIHALLGENGAGKSTLVKIIYGLLQADEGEIRWDGETVLSASPKSARVLGIGMVFQHFSLFDGLNVLENISLGLDRPERMEKLADRVRSISQSYGLPLDPAKLVGNLSVGERQRVEIVRCLLQDPQLLIMDEPTSVLTPQEVGRLFETLRLLAANGCSILYISHKLKEIRALCSRATILRGGRVVGVCDPRAETPESLARLMIGGTTEAVSPKKLGDVSGCRIKTVERFSVRELSVPAASERAISLTSVSFTLAAGEILGIAGIAGNGQAELFETLSGERRMSNSQAILIDGRPCGHIGSNGRRRMGLASVPEERNGHAAIPGFSLTENTLLTGSKGLGLTRAGMIRWRETRSRTRQIIRDLDVRVSGSEASADSLSGGNLQKFVIGREMSQEPTVLIVAQPTWGVDVHAAATIHQALLSLAKSGCAILVMSQDLDELRLLCDRLSVINLGRLSPPLPTHELSLEALGLLMGGVHGAEASPRLALSEPVYAG